MTITKCDRCGEKIKEFSPKYEIAFHEPITGGCFGKIDLCKKCEKIFSEWLREGNSQQENAK